MEKRKGQRQIGKPDQTSQKQIGKPDQTSQNQIRESDQTSQNQQAQKPAYGDEQLIGRGLYRKVRISVKTLDILIVIGILAIVGVLIFGIQHNGYSITFNSRGGSDVAGGSYQYGEQLEIPEDPTREGYTFQGWYLDENCTTPLTEPYEISSDQTFHAKWEPVD